MQLHHHHHIFPVSACLCCDTQQHTFDAVGDSACGWVLLVMSAALSAMLDRVAGETQVLEPCMWSKHRVSLLLTAAVMGCYTTLHIVLLPLN